VFTHVASLEGEEDLDSLMKEKTILTFKGGKFCDKGLACYDLLQSRGVLGLGMCLRSLQMF
jgi:hypothetical protein